MATEFGGISYQQANGYQSALGGPDSSEPSRAVVYESKADKISLLAIAFIAGWIGADVTHNISKLWSEQGQLHVVKTQVVPKLEAKIAQQGCTIDKVATVAADAISANKAAGTPGPDYSDIQPCPVKPTVAPKK